MSKSTHISYVVRQLELALRPYFLQACASAGITPAQFTAMSVLQQRPGVTSSELARRSFVRAQTMAATLEPLVESGLVRRERDPNHARRMRLSLTDRGYEVASDLAARVDVVEKIIVAEFSDAELEQFDVFLRRARKAMRAVGRDARVFPVE